MAVRPAGARQWFTYCSIWMQIHRFSRRILRCSAVVMDFRLVRTEIILCLTVYTTNKLACEIQICYIQ